MPIYILAHYVYACCCSPKYFEFVSKFSFELSKVTHTLVCLLKCYELLCLIEMLQLLHGCLLFENGSSRLHYMLPHPLLHKGVLDPRELS